MSLAAFRAELERTLDEKTLHRLVLSRPSAMELRRSLHLRPTHIRGENFIQITHRHPTRDKVENLTSQATLQLIAPLLGTHFLDAHLETNETAFSLRFSRKGAPRFSRKKLTSNNVISVNHDRQKTRLLNPMQLPWLFDLGIADAKGNILPSRSAKWRQVERFVELLDHAWRDVSWSGERALQVFDMGSGKGYLTFAIDSWFSDITGTRVEVRGIEQRPELVDLCNALAQKHHRTQLSFQSGQIAITETPNIDVLIALHACDTATDDAIALGVKHGAETIVCAPCCQHELRESISETTAISGLLEHGLFRQRQAQLLTDVLRTLLLEREGYHVRVVEFVSSEHTDKNLLLIATRSRKRSATAQSKIDNLKSSFGLESIHLESLLT